MDIRDEITIPGQAARHGDAPAWLTVSPVWPAVRAQTGDGQLYLHQAMGLELVGQGHNVAISTGTASGKSDDCSHGSARDFRSIPRRLQARAAAFAGRLWSSIGQQSAGAHWRRLRRPSGDVTAVPPSE